MLISGACSVGVTYGYYRAELRHAARERTQMRIRIEHLERWKETLTTLLDAVYARKEVVDKDLEHIRGSIGGVHRTVETISQDIRQVNRDLKEVTAGLTQVLVEVAKIPKKPGN
jgi:archaellum component FlaC